MAQDCLGLGRIYNRVMRLLLAFLCAWSISSLQGAEAAASTEAEAQPQTEASSTEVASEATEANEATEATPIYLVQAQFLGNQQGLSDDIESILIFQLNEDSEHEELTSDQIILAHNALDPVFELKEDQTYALGLSKKPNASAVMWVVESAQPIEQKPEQKQDVKTSTATEAMAQDPSLLPGNQLSMQLLDSGATWLCYAQGAGVLIPGTRVELQIPGQDLVVKASVGANDGQFFILRGQSLRTVSALVTRKQTLTVQISAE